MSNRDGNYSITELLEKVQEFIELEEGELNLRTARDYVQRVLQEQPGRGKRHPYDDKVLFKLLFLIRLKRQARHLELMDMGRIIKSLPDDVIMRVAVGKERLRIPDLGGADTHLTAISDSIWSESGGHMRHRLENYPPSVERPVTLSRGKFFDAWRKRTEAGSSTHRSGDAELSEATEEEEWSTFQVGKNARLEVRKPLSVTQQRLVEKIAGLLKEILD